MFLHNNNQQPQGNVLIYASIQDKVFYGSSIF
jgi:hypothetical protein